MFRRKTRNETPTPDLTTGGIVAPAVDETTTPDPAPLPPALAVDHRGWVYIWTRVDSTREQGAKILRLDNRIDPDGVDLGPASTILGGHRFAQTVEDADRRSRAWIDRRVDNAEAEQAAANFVEIAQRRAQTRKDLDEQIAREMDNLTRALDAVLNGHPVPTDTTNEAAPAPTDENTTSDTNQAFTELANLVGTVQNARPFENAYTCDDDPADTLHVEASADGEISVGVQTDGSTGWVFLSTDDAIQVGQDLVDAALHAWKVDGLPEQGVRAPVSNIPDNLLT